MTLGEGFDVRSPSVHPFYGPANLSFREPQVRLWVIVVLGAMISVAAVSSLVWILLSYEGRASADFAAVVVTLSVLCLGSLANVAYSVYCLVFPGHWTLTPTHIYKTRGARMVRTLELSAIPQPTIAPLVRHGLTIGVWVHFGSAVVITPSVEVASALVTAWKTQCR